MKFSLSSSRADEALEGASSLKLSTSSLAVVGLGYVGLPLALLARQEGFQVTGIDIDPRKRASIASGEVPDLDVRLLSSLRAEPLALSGAFSAVEHSRVIVVCVPTPVTDEYEPDLSMVKSACMSVARHLKPGHLIILESTVHPGTSEELLIPLMERESGLIAGIEFDFAHCPERINPGDARWPVDSIPRVVGGITQRACVEAARFYRSILSAPVHEMHSIREAEAVKMVENSFRDVNIAFVNELAMSFTKLGIDVEHVLEGASTKPFGFMRHSPGCGVGGHCIPVDPYYLIRYAKQNGFTHAFLSLARSINNGMPSFTVSLLEAELAKRHQELTGATVALLGLSYKSDVRDLRESPAFEIQHALQERGATVRTFDPLALEHSQSKTLAEALTGADAALIATAHRPFRNLGPEAFLSHGVSIVIDGRNCLDKKTFAKSSVAYRGIGR